MDLKLFFDTIDENLSKHDFSKDSLIQSVYLNKNEIPNISEAHIAIIGIKETQGGQGISNTGVKYIREKLYNLKKSIGDCQIIDLGNLRNGLNLDETYKKLQSVCHYLMQKQILPVIIGGPHNMDIGQYRAYEEEEKLVSICNVDSRVDLDTSQDAESQKHIHDIFLHEPNYLFNYHQLAHQSYFVNPNTLKVLQQLNFAATRIGELRDNFKKVEPIVRDADMLTFDLSAIQSSIAPGGNQSDIFGLTGEEACQIMWYAGLNDKLSSLGIYEYNPHKDSDEHQTAQLTAIMIWYFIEGFKNRKNERGFQTNDYIKYVVAMPSEPESISFYKSRLSDKWWMEVPKVNHEGPFSRNVIISCDYEDYETALAGEVPERWISMFTRFS